MFGVFIFFALTLAVTIMLPTFLISKTHRWELRGEAREYLEKNCEANVTRGKKAQDLCDDYRHEVALHPSTRAFYDMLYEYGICFGPDCTDSIFARMLAPFVTLLWVLIISFACSCFCIFYCGSKYFEVIRRPNLPMIDSKKTQ
jgi:hypothetical protein